jgi:glycosyltransferase involved in cell wall biosynthesis
MIIKNEEQFIKDCLENLKELVDEIIIVDTGSTDSTIKIIKDLNLNNLKILNFEWQDDFSAARNFSLQHATHEWILVLDADEQIAKEDHSRIRNLITNKEDHVAFNLVQRSYTDDFSEENWQYRGDDSYKDSEGYTGWRPSPLIRLFRKDDRIQFTGAIHELVEYSITKMKGKVLKTDIPIHHFKVARSKERVDQKLALYQKLCEKKVMENPQSPKALFELGNFYRFQGNNKEAIALLAKCIGIQPKFAEAYHSMGEAFQQMEEYDSAVECFEKALENKEDFKDAHFSLGICYTKMNKLPDAAEAFQHGLLIDAQNVNALTNLGAVFEKLKMYDKALKSLISAVNLAPNNARAYFNLAILYEKVNKPEKAIIAYEKAAEFNYKRKDDILKRLEELKSGKKPEQIFSQNITQ